MYNLAVYKGYYFLKVFSRKLIFSKGNEDVSRSHHENETTPKNSELPHMLERTCTLSIRTLNTNAKVLVVYTSRM